MSTDKFVTSQMRIIQENRLDDVLRVLKAGRLDLITRTTALELWKRVAAGDLLDPVVLAFLIQVADQIVRADDTGDDIRSKKRRADLLQTAICLDGKIDRDRALKDETEAEFAADLFEDVTSDPVAIAKRLERRHKKDAYKRTLPEWTTWVKSIRDSRTRKTNRRKGAV